MQGHVTILGFTPNIEAMIALRRQNFHHGRHGGRNF